MEDRSLPRLAAWVHNPSVLAGPHRVHSGGCKMVGGPRPLAYGSEARRPDLASAYLRASSIAARWLRFVVRSSSNKVVLLAIPDGGGSSITVATTTPATAGMLLRARFPPCPCSSAVGWGPPTANWVPPKKRAAHAVMMSVLFGGHTVTRACLVFIFFSHCLLFAYGWWVTFAYSATRAYLYREA